MNFRQRITLHLLLTIVLGSVAFAQVVGIPDPGLRTAIADRLNLPRDTPFTYDHMLSMVHLDADGLNISDLTGLNTAINLRSLELRYNNLRDITPLGVLTNLRSILLNDGNTIEDLTPLANLIHLEELNLRGNPISNLSPLSNLTNLRALDLGFCRIVNISPLSNLTQLETLQLNGNQIVNVTPLAKLQRLTELEIQENFILDRSPLDGLSLTEYIYDQFCDMPPLPLESRLLNRSYPKFTGPEWIYGYDSRVDLMFGGIFGIYFRPDGTMVGQIDAGIQKRERLIAENPNLIFIATINMKENHIPTMGDDWPYWVRDTTGNIISGYRADIGLMNFTHPDIQDLIVNYAIQVDKCGLFDGILLDNFQDLIPILPIDIIPLQVQQAARASMLQRIRKTTRTNFLILANTNSEEIPLSAPYINGLSMETGLPSWFHTEAALNAGLQQTARTLLWAEENLRPPRVNGLFGEAPVDKLTDSPTNRRWVRLLTTLSLTHADGYTGYWIHDQERDNGFWFEFFSTDLGSPTESQGPTIRQSGRAVYPGIYERVGGVQPQRGNTRDYVAGGGARRRQRGGEHRACVTKS